MNVKFYSSLQNPVKLTTSFRRKLTTLFTGKELREGLLLGDSIAA